MPEDELFVRIVCDDSDLKAKLGEAQNQTKKWGTDTASAAKEASDAMAKGANETTGAMDKTTKSYDDTTQSAVAHGKEVRQLIRDIKVSNIEEIQRNQLLQMTGNTMQQWGAKMQGSSNLANKAMTQLTDTIRNATGGVMDYVGAGVQLVGKAIDMYAGISRLILVYQMETYQNTLRTAATTVNTTAIQANTAAQWGLNAAQSASPIGLLVAGIGASVITVGMAIGATNQYINNQKNMQQNINNTIDTLDKLKTKMRETIMGTNEPSDLLKQKSDIETNISDLEEKRRAAEELGLSERAEGYMEQIRQASEDLAMVQKQIENAKEEYTPASTNLISQAKKMREEAEKAYIAANPYTIGMGPEQMKKHDEEMNAAGRKAVQSFLNGMLVESDNASTRYILEQVAEHLGYTLEAHSPPRYGPLKEIEHWGQNLMKAYHEGMQSEAPKTEGTTERIAQSLSTHTENRNINNNTTFHNAPNINISGMMDLTNPNTARLIAKIVNDELRRKAVVS